MKKAIKKYRLAVINEYDEFAGLISTERKSERSARQHLLYRARKLGKPFGVMFYA